MLGKSHRHGSVSETGHGRFRHRSRTNELFCPGGTPADPLNLENAKVEDGGQEQTDIQAKVEESMAVEIEPFVPNDSSDPLNLKKMDKTRKRRQHCGGNVEADGNCSPLSKRRGGSRNQSPAPQSEGMIKDDVVSTKKSKREYFNNRYRYGNFDRYYGNRCDPGQKDYRLDVLSKDWFHKKTVLDIGSNAGFLTLSIAKDFEPRRVLGIDIDEHLVGVARKNIRHYCDANTELVGKYPASFANALGPVANHSLSFSTKFPDNVWFRRENYVLDSDELLETVEEEFDVILALSITKWIHLNFGDAGLKRFFRRAFKQLHPGGKLILEPQLFDTYKKRAKMTPELWRNFAAIQFKPEQFTEFLLSEVGFEKMENLGVPNAKSKGFARPLEVYFKRGPVFEKSL